MHGHHRYSGLGKHLRSSLILICGLPTLLRRALARKVDIRALYLAKSAARGGFAGQSLIRARRVLKTPRTPVITLCIMQTAVCGLRYVYCATMEGKAILATFCRPLCARQENIEAKLPRMAVLGSFCLDGRTRPALVRRIDILLSSHGSSEPVNRSHECRASMLQIARTVFSRNLTEQEKIGIFEQEYDIKCNEEVRKEVGIMCNLSQGIKEEGIREGYSRGLEQGVEQEKIQTVLTMLEEKYPIDQIARVTRLTTEQVQSIIDKSTELI